MHVYESRSRRLDARGATPSLPCERLSYASARLEGDGHDDQPACRVSQNNSDKQGEGGEACAGLHARPKDWAFQNQCAHLDSMLFTARGISAHFAYTSIIILLLLLLLYKPAISLPERALSQIFLPNVSRVSKGVHGHRAIVSLLLYISTVDRGPLHGRH